MVQYIAAILLSMLSEGQSREDFWEKLDCIPDILAWIRRQDGALRLSFGSTELLVVHRPQDLWLSIEFSSPSKWGRLLEGLEAARPLLPELPAPPVKGGLSSIFDNLRPVIHDVAEILADEGWRLEVSLDGEPFLTMGAGITESHPQGFGPTMLRLPVLSRFLSRIENPSGH